MRNKTLAILNLMALIMTIIINYLSNTGFINGKTMKIVSNENHNLFTPASYAFSVWGLIYLFLIGFVIYSFVILKRKRECKIIGQVNVWFIISCVLNCLWIFAWLNEFIGTSVILMVLLLMSLLKIIVNVKAELTNPPFRIVALVWWPFSIYSGWISVALIANVAAYLTKIQWDGWSISPVTWTIIMIILAGILNVFMTWKRNMREYAIVGSWALIAVAIANVDASSAVFLVAIITAVVIVVNCLLHGVKNFRGFGEDF
ncbi:hypothetical protein ACFX5U_09515 [Sphingobacterium sp. SG20118]|uniref:hypothetical protein n=1 Tax=Sphingobacterium sp. SG20118 TaxID=3367156 RepID=UPI0037DFC7FF